VLKNITIIRHKKLKRQNIKTALTTIKM